MVGRPFYQDFGLAVLGCGSRLHSLAALRKIGLLDPTVLPLCFFDGFAPILIAFFNHSLGDVAVRRALRGEL